MILTLAMVVGMSGQAFAVEELASSESNTGIPMEMVGVLTADDGTEYTIEGELFQTNMLNANSEFGELVQTYKFSVPASVLGGGSLTEEGRDTNSLTEAFLTIHLATREVSEPGVVDGVTEYLLTRVSGYWSENSPNIYVDYGVLDYYCYWDGSTMDTQLENTNVANFFDVSTGFSEYVYVGFGHVGAKLTLHMYMGSRKWTFHVTNNIIGIGA